MDLHDVYSDMKSDIDAATSWCDELYLEYFGAQFQETRDIFNRLQSKDRPISDEELMWILMDLPMKLFDVSETLNRFRISLEVIKVKIKQKESEVSETSPQKNAAKRKADGVLATLEDKIVASVFSTVVTRVENEITFCKELIMGAKKVWDSRRKSEQSNPVAPTVSDLPEYIRGC